MRSTDSSEISISTSSRTASRVFAFGGGGMGAFFRFAGSGGGGAMAWPDGVDVGGVPLGKPVGQRESDAEEVKAGTRTAGGRDSCAGFADGGGACEVTEPREACGSADCATGVGNRGGGLGMLEAPGGLDAVGASEANPPLSSRSRDAAATFSWEARSQNPPSTAASAPRRTQATASSRAPLRH